MGRVLIVLVLCLLVVWQPRVLAQQDPPRSYLPFVFGSGVAQATPTRAAQTITPTPFLVATATPTRVPSFTNCVSEANPATAPNYPIRIVTIQSTGDTVTLQNVSASQIDLTNWTMCSLNGGEHHPIEGIMGPGETHVFRAELNRNVWSDVDIDPGALYDPQGYLISYVYEHRPATSTPTVTPTSTPTATSVQP